MQKPSTCARPPWPQLLGCALAVTLTACGGQTAAPGAPESKPGESAPAAASTDRTFDTSGVQKVDEIAALVPAAVAERGTLLIGASADYAPAEFRADDLKTYIGYDVDLGRGRGQPVRAERQHLVRIQAGEQIGRAHV